MFVLIGEYKGDYDNQYSRYREAVAVSSFKGLLEEYQIKLKNRTAPREEDNKHEYVEFFIEEVVLIESGATLEAKSSPTHEERIRRLEKDFYAMVHAQREMADRICSPVIRQLEAKLDHIVDGITRMHMFQPAPVVQVPLKDVSDSIKRKLPDMVCPACGDSTFRLEQYTSGQEWTCATCKNIWKAE